MQLNSENEAQARLRVQEDRIRQIVREEITEAFRVLGRAADALDAPYDTAELDSRALSNIQQAAENTVRRMTCDHPRTFDWNGRKCGVCGEPQPEPEPTPVNPFEEKNSG